MIRTTQIEAKMILLLLGSAPIATAHADPPSGDWDVKLDGQMTFTAKTNGAQDALCETGTQTFIAREDDSFVRLSTVDPTGIVAEASVEAMGRIFHEFATELHGTIGEEPKIDVTRLFVFHFEFDNGKDPEDYEYELNYHANEVLEAETSFVQRDTSSFVPQVAVHRNSWEQSGWLGALPAGEALATLNQAFGGIEGYVGTWLAADGEPTRVLGVEALQSGDGNVGKSLFLVTGKFENERLMRGNWKFDENSQLLDCISSATGTGTWEAKWVGSASQ